jgi:hypothetical protein
VANKLLFKSLYRHRDKGDECAQRHPPGQGGGLRNPSAIEPGIFWRIDLIGHALSFKEKELCAGSQKIDNINSGSADRARLSLVASGSQARGQRLRRVPFDRSSFSDEKFGRAATEEPRVRLLWRWEIQKPGSPDNR